jgi:hypothetical protein
LLFYLRRDTICAQTSKYHGVDSEEEARVPITVHVSRRIRASDEARRFSIRFPCTMKAFSITLASSFTLTLRLSSLIIKVLVAGEMYLYLRDPLASCQQRMKEPYAR